MAMVEIEGLSYWYPTGDIPALREVSLKVEEGEFVLLTGPSGCGKTTLMRLVNGLVPHFHGGRLMGRVRVCGLDVLQSNPRRLSAMVGMVFQDPEDQLVCTTVEKEVAFGLENVGLPVPVIAKRVEEMLTGLGISRLRNSFLPELSGGESQKVILASVLALHPRVLLLDEPTSQLDPLSAEELLTVVRRIHEETGTLVIMSEHRLERCYHYATRILHLEHGEIIFDGTPREAARWWGSQEDAYLPPVSRIFSGLGWKEIPLTVNQARKLISNHKAKDRMPLEAGMKGKDGGKTDEALLETRKLWHIYDPTGTEALRGVDLKLDKGDRLVIMGENGAGKSTLLRCMLGLLAPTRGNVFLFGAAPSPEKLPDLATRLAYCPQNPNTYFLSSSAREELLRTMKLRGYAGGGEEKLVAEQLDHFGLGHLAERNPRDLSSGEKVKLVLASALLPPHPELLVLDEPTRGVDFQSKKKILALLREHGEGECTVVVVTHDVEFAANLAERAAILGGGRVIAGGTAAEILGDSLFFSPQVNRLFADICPGIIREEEGRAILAGLVERSPGESTSSSSSLS